MATSNNSISGIKNIYDKIFHYSLENLSEQYDDEYIQEYKYICLSSVKNLKYILNNVSIYKKINDCYDIHIGGSLWRTMAIAIAIMITAYVCVCEE